MQGVVGLCEAAILAGEPDKDNKVIRFWCHGNKAFICNSNTGNRQISANGAALGRRLEAHRRCSVPG